MENGTLEHELNECPDARFGRLCPRCWSARWVWPIGTRVLVKGTPGTVVKENSTTVRVAFDSDLDQSRRGLVSKSVLIRL